MKKVPCAYSGCGDRRVHFTLPDIERGQQTVEVEDDFLSETYCSLTCMILAGKLSVRSEKEHRNEPE